MIHDSVQIGHYILSKVRAQSKSVVPLKLIKLTYLAHGWMLGLYDKPLVSDDAEAWPYGPVFLRLYKAVKRYRYSEVLDIDLGDRDPANLQNDEQDIVQQVLKVYGDYSASQLSDLTHRKGTPWAITWDMYNKRAVIPQDLIAQHYKEKSATNNASE